MQNICWFIWSQSIDETVLQETSHAEESTASAAVAVENLPCEAEFAIEAFPKIPTKKIEMPADICPPNNTFEDDELEALVMYQLICSYVLVINHIQIRLSHPGQMHQRPNPLTVRQNANRYHWIRCGMIQIAQ